MRSDDTGNFLKGGINRNGHINVILRNKHINVHRLVANAFMSNPEGKRYVDHINNIETDNRLTNLRFATHTENNINASMRKDYSSGIKGVSWSKRDEKWIAQIQIDGIKIMLGRYDDIEDAKRARIKKANEAFGVYMNVCEK